MGQVIRLDTSFNNNNLKKLIDYNFEDIKSQILSLPTLRAFYDATDVGNLVVSGGKVTQLKDLSVNNLHFNQPVTAKAPNHSAAAFGNIGGLYFNGLQSMKAAGLFSGSAKGTIVIFMHATGLTTGASKIIFSDAARQDKAIYAQNAQLLAFNAKTTMALTGVDSKYLNFVTAYDGTNDTATIYADGKSSAGAMSGAGAPTGAANLGTWTDTLSSNNYIGYIGHVMVFDEDLSKNKVVRDLLTEYAKRKYRTDVK